MSLSALPTALLIPPANLVPLALVGWLLARWYPRLGRGICGVSLLLLLLLGLPVTGRALIASLEAGIPREIARDAGVGAIVVLSADASMAGPGGVLESDGIGMMTLERLHAGVVLARRTGLPLLVTGGVVEGGGADIATRMARVLTADFAMTARWVEPRSADTWENAAFSAAMLREAGIKRVYVVTNAWHMKRALIAFRHFGIVAIAAPSRFDIEPGHKFEDFMPRVSAWMRSYFAVHEWIGCAWYGLRS